MVQLIPELNPHQLVPPLLACLPTAFVSSRAPPALLSLLSPLLRQRVELLSDGSQSSDSWLPLLCWDSELAGELPALVESGLFELQSITAEAEYSETDPVLYRRLDKETFHAMVLLRNLGLTAVYLWCVSDVEGTESGWKLGNLSIHHSSGDGPDDWQSTIAAAEEDYMALKRILHEADSAGGGQQHPIIEIDYASAQEDEDAYWRQYDNTPSRTPEKANSPAPPAAAFHKPQDPRDLEAEYYSQYAEVEPALDSQFPTDAEDSNLTAPPSRQQVDSLPTRGILQSSDATTGSLVSDQSQLRGSQVANAESNRAIEQPYSGSFSSDRPNNMSNLESTLAPRIGVKLHIERSIQSLHSLAIAAGIGHEEFQDVVQAQLRSLNQDEDRIQELRYRV